jgi:hypothetical protein
LEDSHQYVDKDKVQLYSSVFNTPNGKKVLADLVKFTGFYADLGTTDSLTQANYIGQRRVILRILGLLNPGSNIDAVEQHREITNE